MKKFFLFCIKKYQKYISLDYGFFGKVFPNTRICRFSPSCSQYTFEAVEKYGAFKGSFLGVKRVFKCNPLSTPIAGTYDPVV
jgi:uncharacterized protein